MHIDIDQLHRDIFFMVAKLLSDRAMGRTDVDLGEELTILRGETVKSISDWVVGEAVSINDVPDRLSVATATCEYFGCVLKTWHNRNEDGRDNSRFLYNLKSFQKKLNEEMNKAWIEFDQSRASLYQAALALAAREAPLISSKEPDQINIVSRQSDPSRTPRTAKP